MTRPFLHSRAIFDRVQALSVTDDESCGRGEKIAATSNVADRRCTQVPSRRSPPARASDQMRPLREPAYENNAEAVFGTTAVMQLELRNWA